MRWLTVLLYLLALVTCLACTVLLWREYLRRRLGLLLWSTLCFAGLSVSNLLLCFDLLVFPMADLRIPRLLATLTGMLFLLYGFIWEAER